MFFEPFNRYFEVKKYFGLKISKILGIATFQNFIDINAVFIPYLYFEARSIDSWDIQLFFCTRFALRDII